MLTIAECRALIENSEKYTDKDIEQIREDLHKLADLAFDVWSEKKEPKSAHK